MTSNLKQFKRRASLCVQGVGAAHTEASPRSSAVRPAEVLMWLRAYESGLTQAEVRRAYAETNAMHQRLRGLNRPMPKHSPSIATLQRYAKALGYTVQVKSGEG